MTKNKSAEAPVQLRQVLENSPVKVNHHFHRRVRKAQAHTGRTEKGSCARAQLPFFNVIMHVLLDDARGVVVHFQIDAVPHLFPDKQQGLLLAFQKHRPLPS